MAIQTNTIERTRSSYQELRVFSLNLPSGLTKINNRIPRVANSILQRVSVGDPSAMAECIDRYAPLVWMLVQRRGLRRVDGEDMVQEIFVELWRSSHRFDPAVASESTFISMVARRRLIDRLRKQGRAISTPDSMETAEMVPAPALLSNDDADEAAKARELMQQLREDERRVLELSIDEGLSQTQIAEKTDLPLGTVKTHARRGLIRLRNMLTGSVESKGGAS